MMKSTKLLILAIFIGITFSNLALAKVYPLEYWALRDVMTAAEVSPDGKHLAVLKIPNKTGNAIIEVYKTEDIGKPNAKPFRVNADPMEFRNIYWVSDTDIVANLRQKVRDRIEGYNQGVYENRLARLDIAKEKITNFGDESWFVENRLSSKPDKIIVSLSTYKPSGAKIAEPFRPRSYWELDLKKGSKKLLIRGKLALGNIQFDSDGNPWLARGFDIKKREFIWFYRNPGAKDWTEFRRQSEDDFEDFEVWGFDKADRNILFVSARNGNDKVGFWEYNVVTKSYGELIYRRNDVDVAGARYHSNIWTNPNEVTAIVHQSDKNHYEYMDGAEEATYNLFQSKIPYAHNIRIVSRSRDGQTLTLINSGPRDPGTYYLFHEGEIKSVGSRQPLIASEDLADVSYIKYKARDGLTIPAYVTTPKGNPPFPLIVLPHGGPFVSEMIAYDEWGQVLANNGYMVLQPQYRGSYGHGFSFQQAAYNNGSQGGYAMQDDKDDGALHLIQQGLVDKDRVAMFGWSYGGYAAFVAAARKKQIYQCVIAGAGVADTNQQMNYIRDNMRGAPSIQFLKFWDKSISPIDNVGAVNIPILVVHGDVDQRVPPLHAKKYEKALKKNNIPYEMLWLKGADHFYSTLFYNHQKDLYDNLISFLKNDCGPGGL